MCLQNQIEILLRKHKKNNKKYIFHKQIIFSYEKHSSLIIYIYISRKSSPPVSTQSSPPLLVLNWVHKNEN